MARNKSELMTRDAYARRFAAVHCARIHSARLSGDERTKVVVVEAEDSAEWDDVVVSVTTDKTTATTRYQVKRQQTDLDEKAATKLLKCMSAADQTQHRVVVPANVAVSGVGSLHTLRGLCDRVRQVGATWAGIEATLRKEEKEWVTFIEEATPAEMTAFDALRRLGVEFAGFEEDMDRRAQDALQPYFGDSWHLPWQVAVSLCTDADGVANITGDLLVEKLPRPPEAADDELYADLLDEADRLLWLDRWQGLCGTLVNAMLPVEFAEDVERFRHEIHTTALPGTRPSFEHAITELAERIGAYVDHFMSRAERRYPKLYAEDKSWKRGYNPNYDAEADAARQWDANLIRLLQNAVVALNRFCESVRSSLKSDYRRRGGVFALYDELGVRNSEHLVGHYVVPVEYDDDPAA